MLSRNKAFDLGEQYIVKKIDIHVHVFKIGYMLYLLSKEEKNYVDRMNKFAAVDALNLYIGYCIFTSRRNSHMSNLMQKKD